MPADVPDLLAAVRAGLSDDAPDPDVVPDPLATFAALTMRLPGTVAPDPHNPQGLPAVFSALNSDDRAFVAELLDEP